MTEHIRLHLEKCYTKNNQISNFPEISSVQVHQMAAHNSEQQ